MSETETTKATTAAGGSRGDAVMMERLLDRLPGGAFAFRMTPDGKSNWIYVSRKYIELYEMPEDELLRDPAAVVRRIVPEDAELANRAAADSLMTGATFDWSGRLRYDDGRERWVRTVASVERDADGAASFYGQVVDVTEQQRTARALEESEAARRQSEATLRAILDHSPVDIVVVNTNGQITVTNTAARRMLGSMVELSEGATAPQSDLYRADRSTVFPQEELPHAVALSGRESEAEVYFAPREGKAGMLIHAAATPLTGSDGQIVAAVATVRDITQERALEDEIRERNRQLAESEQTKAELIERLRFAIDELSNPILEVWDGVLAMPIIGLVDSRRTADMAQRLLAEVARSGAEFVIVDLTGVEVVDTKTADNLIKLVRKVELVGARCVLTGIRPAVAQTLVDIGVDFGGLATLRNLKHGLRESLRGARRGIEELEGDGDAHDGDRGRSERGGSRGSGRSGRRFD